jgi:Tfp pilus assembly protein PilP
MRSAITLGIGLLIAATAPALRAQKDPIASSNGNSVTDQAAQTAQQPAKPGTPTAAKPGTPPPAKPAAQTAAKPASQTPAKPAAQAPAKPAGQTPAKPATAAANKPASQAAGKPAAGAAAKPAAKATGKSGKRKGAKAPAKKPTEKAAGPAGAPKAAAESEVKAARRDPFESLLSHSQGKANPNLPPGKAGLQVSTLRLDGIVRAPNGMIAVVSNPQSRTYFLREGDHLYDGSVDKITMDGVSFHEEGKDAFGKPVERQVNKRIYSTSSGEQQ